MGEVVNSPSGLARSLAHVGRVDDEKTGYRLQPSLAPGQRLVDREGRLWRWDGFVSLGHGPSLAAEQLRHANRLAVLESDIATLKTSAVTAETGAAAARAERQHATEAGGSARQRWLPMACTLGPTG